MCLPETIESRVVQSLFEHDRNYLTVRSCSKQCIGTCQRVCSKRVVFPGSIYEKTIDVGTCEGECGGNGYMHVCNVMWNNHNCHSTSIFIL